ncbi:DUF935 domain-containing protein [Chrysiogenes arsenatis]|uniref:DUF935 domain-containing protein n=1 Tax=Chrysiogenes arsenatis TaxID=309797 RepID=UPI0004139A3B|nr:DUF935 family protein [Chrysiogenes arsenatis]
MSKGLWITPHEFIEFRESSERQALGQEIASRSTAWDFSAFIGLLPDPDPVLLARGDSPRVLEGLMADAHVTSVVQTRKLGTLRRDFRWRAGSLHNEEPSPAAEKLRRDLVEDLERIDLYHLVSEILDAPYYGYTPIEILWRAAGGRMRIDNLVAKPRRWFGFDDTGAPRFISANDPTGELLPFGKFVFARHFPTYDNPYGLRLLSRCFWPVTFKRGGMSFWVTFVEKYGMPFLFGTYPKGTSPVEQQALLRRLASMVQDAVAVGPEGSRVEIQGGGGSSGSSGGGGETYAKLLATMDAEISKALMGQTLTAETSQRGGAYSQSKTHEAVLEVYREGDEQMVKTAMEEIAWLYGQINAPDVPTPSFVWWEDEDPQQAFAERDKSLSESGRLRFTKPYYMRRYGLQEGDFELVDPVSNDPAAREFAEPSTRFTPEQEALETLIDVATREAAVAVQVTEEQLVRIVLESDSYEQAMEKVLALWPTLDGTAIAEQMEQVLLAADLLGRWSAQAEASDGN